MVERCNRTLLDMLATAAHNTIHQTAWDLYIQKVCLAYNSSIHSSTEFSPLFSYVWAGSEIADRLMYRSNPIEQTTLPEYVQKLKDGLENAYFLVREQCESEHKKLRVLMMRRSTINHLPVVSHQLHREVSSENFIIRGRVH